MSQKQTLTALQMFVPL